MSADNIFLGLILGSTLGVWVSIFLHELAHALVGKWIGYDVTSFGIGLARPLLVFGWGDTRVYICLNQPHAGYTFILSPPGHNPTTGQVLAFGFAGIFAHILLCVLCLVLWLFLDWGTWFWATVTVLNAVTAVENLLPFPHLMGQWRHRTDGKLMLDVLRGKGPGRMAMDSIKRLQQFRKLWQEIGDRRMEADALNSAAVAWGMFGDSPYGKELKAEAETLDPRLAIKSESETLLDQGSELQKAGRFEEAAERFTKARQWHAARQDLGGEIAALCYQAGLAEEGGRVEEAEQFLRELDALPIVQSVPALAAMALRNRLEVFAKRMTVEQLHQSEHVYESIRARGLTDEWDWILCQQVAKLYIEREAWKEAEEPSTRAFKAAVSLWQGMPTLEDRQRFAKLASEFQQRTWDLFTRLGKQEEAENITDLFVEESEDTAAKEAAEEVRRQRETRYYRLGWILTGINALFCGIGFLALRLLNISGSHVWNSPFVASLMILMGMLALFLLGTILYQVMYFLVRFTTSKNQESPGTTTLALAIMPWLVSAALGIAVPVLYWIL